MPLKELKKVRRWELWLPYALIVIAAFGGSLRVEKLAHKQVQERTERIVSVCNAENETRTQVLALIHRNVRPVTPNARQAIADADRSLAPKNCRKLGAK